MKTLNRITDLVKEVRRIEGENTNLQPKTLVNELKESFDNVQVKFKVVEGMLLKETSKGEYTFLNSNLICVKVSEKKGYIIELEWCINEENEDNDYIVVSDIVNVNKCKRVYR